MNIKKLTAAALSAAFLLTPVVGLATPESTRTSNGLVDFREGELTIPDERCPDGQVPDHNLTPPCPGGGPDIPGVEDGSPAILVPNFDFGSHQISTGAYLLPALPSVQPVFGALPEGYTLGDIDPALTADATAHAHFIEVNDFRGSGTGWHLNVSRTEFFSGAAWAAANPTGGFANLPTAVTGTGENFLRGALLTFNNISSFAIGTGATATSFPDFTQARHLAVPGPTEGTATFVSAAATQGRGVHRVQIGGLTSQAATIAALTDRADHSPALARNNAVQLSLPTQVQIQSGQTYTAVLTWDLMAGPGSVALTDTLPPWAQ